MIIRILPRPHIRELDIIIEEQANYYGARNSHIIDYLRHKKDTTHLLWK
jgi:hypothetical protein